MAVFKSWPKPSAMPITAANGKPWNFLILFGDDWPLDVFNEMPGFAATYAADFLSFPNAVSEIPLCFPSRAAFQTGQSHRFNTVTSNDSGATYEAGPINYTLPVVMQRAGWYVGWVGKIYNGLGEGGAGGWGSLPWQHPGVNYMAGQWGAPDYFNWDEIGSDGTIRASHGTTDTNVAGTDYAVDVERLRCLEFLDEVPTGRPWCLIWPSKACHQGASGGGEPLPPARHTSTSVTYTETSNFGADGVALGVEGNWLTQQREDPWNASAIAAVRTSHTLALQTARALDEALVAVLDEIDARGETANTVVMICTDNAIAFGELRLNGKGTPHKSGTDLILKVKIPGGETGTCYAPVCVYDMLPTICALSGARPLYSPYGMSIHPLLADKAADFREAVFMNSPDKKPTFSALKYGGNPGAVYYRIIPGGGLTASTGGWTDLDQTTNAVIAGADATLEALENSVA